jgi:hypothetical protein
MYGVDMRRIYCGHQGRSDPLIPLYQTGGKEKKTDCLPWGKPEIDEEENPKRNVVIKNLFCSHYRPFPSFSLYCPL